MMSNDKSMVLLKDKVFDLFPPLEKSLIWVSYLKFLEWSVMFLAKKWIGLLGKIKHWSPGKAITNLYNEIKLQCPKSNPNIC